MVFCPRDGNTLLVEMAGQMRFFCPTCPYGASKSRLLVAG